MSISKDCSQMNEKIDWNIYVEFDVNSWDDMSCRRCTRGFAANSDPE
jgi:hypothetical protein